MRAGTILAIRLVAANPKKIIGRWLYPFEVWLNLDNPTYLKRNLMYLCSYFPRMRADTILAIRPVAAKAPSTTKSTQKTKSSLIMSLWSLVRFGQSKGSTSLSKVALISKSDMFDMVKLFCASVSLKRIENITIRQKLDKNYLGLSEFNIICSLLSPIQYTSRME